MIAIGHDNRIRIQHAVLREKVNALLFGGMRDRRGHHCFADKSKRDRVLLEETIHLKKTLGEYPTVGRENCCSLHEVVSPWTARSLQAAL
jgi:hypothetical protein